MFAGCEGRCGMAAVRLKDGATFDGDKLYTFTRDTLPTYAAPRFIRIQVSGTRPPWGAPGGLWGAGVGLRLRVIQH